MAREHVKWVEKRGENVSWERNERCVQVKLSEIFSLVGDGMEFYLSSHRVLVATRDCLRR